MDKKTKAGCLVFLILTTCLLAMQARSDKEVSYGADTYIVSTGSNARLDEGILYIDESGGFQGYFAKTREISLKKGVYALQLHYRADHDYHMMITANYDQVIYDMLEASLNDKAILINLENDTDTFKVQFEFDGKGSLSIGGLEILGAKPLYTDAYYLCALFALTGLALLYLAGSRRVGVLPVNSKLTVLLFVGVFLYVNLPLYNSYLPLGHDIYFHAMRIEGIKSGLQNGVFPVTIYPGPFNQYGMLGSMYPDFFLYIPAILRLLGVSMATAYKSLLMLINAAALFTAYIAVKSMSGSWYAAVLCSILYCLSPYRLDNLYIRSAIGESLAMVFLPLVVAGLYHILAGKRLKWYLLVIGCTGIVNSHIISTLLTAVLAIPLILLYLVPLFREKRIFSLLKAAGAAAAVNAGFLLPFLCRYLSDTKTNVGSILLNKFYLHAAYPQQLFFTGAVYEGSHFLNEGSGPEMPLTLGVAGGFCILVVLAGLILYQAQKDSLYYFVMALAALGILFAMAGTTLFPWRLAQGESLAGQFISILQYPFRFLSAATILLIIPASILLARCDALYRFQRQIPLILFPLVLLSAVNMLDTASTSGVGLIKTEGISQHTKYYMEYLPLGTEPSSYYTNALFFSDDKAVSTVDYMKKGTDIIYTYTCSSEKEYVEFPLFFYQGYQAKSSEGDILPLRMGTDSRIRLQLDKTSAPRTILLSYQDPFYVAAARLLSVLSAAAFCAAAYLKKRRQRKDSYVLQK